MQSPQRQLALWEIDRGTLGLEMQMAFCNAQASALKHNRPCVVTVKVVVSPPDPNNPQYGNIAYEVGLKAPTRRSAKLITELQGGYIVGDGESIANVLQQDLFAGARSFSNAAEQQAGENRV